MKNALEIASFRLKGGIAIEDFLKASMGKWRKVLQRNKMGL